MYVKRFCNNESNICVQGKEKLADERRKELARGCLSDHLMLVNAVWGWEDAKDDGRAAENDYCWHYFLSINTLKVSTKWHLDDCYT